MEKWYALSSIELGLKRTKKLLFNPIQIRLWLKLALIVFLMGLGGVGGNFNIRGGSGDLPSIAEDLQIPQWISGDVLLIAFIVIVFIVSLVLIFAYISAVFSFIFLDSVVREKTEIVAGLKRFLGNGFSLFLFRLVLGISAFLMAIMIILVSFSPLILSLLGYLELSQGITLFLVIFGLLIAVALIIPLSVFTGLIQSFTDDFVVPVMYLRGDGLVDGWKKLIRLIKKDWLQFLLYVVINLCLHLISGIVYFILSMTVSVVCLVILLLIAVAVVAVFLVFWALSVDVWGVLSSISAPLLICIILFVIFISLLLSYIIILVNLPIYVFFRYYTILFIQKVDPELSIIEGEG